MMSRASTLVEDNNTRSCGDSLCVQTESAALRPVSTALDPRRPQALFTTFLREVDFFGLWQCNQAPTAEHGGRPRRRPPSTNHGGSQAERWERALLGLGLGKPPPLETWHMREILLRCQKQSRRKPMKREKRKRKREKRKRKLAMSQTGHETAQVMSRPAR